MKEKISKKELIECVGLWLAEGDTETNDEVTLTNNSIEIILFFCERIIKIYDGENKPRIYVYSPSERKMYDSMIFNKIQIRFYQDFRANRPYYIFRLADVSFIRKWHEIVRGIKKDKDAYEDLLRDFFAGEGNVKFDSVQGERTVRIAQKKRDKFLESIFRTFKLTFEFDKEKRIYWIRGKKNLEKLYNIKIASLHPEKQSDFQKMMESYNKPRKYTRKEVYDILKEPKRIKTLSKVLNKPWREIFPTLKKLKEEEKVGYFRKGRNVYWGRMETVKKVLLNRKIKLLLSIDKPKIINELARETGVYRKVISKRLKEMKRLGLVNVKDGKWIRTKEGDSFVSHGSR